MADGFPIGDDEEDENMLNFRGKEVTDFIFSNIEGQATSRAVFSRTCFCEEEPPVTPPPPGRRVIHPTRLASEC